MNDLLHLGGGRCVAFHPFANSGLQPFLFGRFKVDVMGPVQKSLSDGLFIREAQAVAAQHPDVAWREMDIDAMAADLYSRPERHDVILITNMFGDILSNAAVAMSGSLGLAAALNAGDDHAVANAGHGSAPDIAGKDLANPTGLILSCAMLLDWLGTRRGERRLNEAAAAIERAVDAVLAVPERRTRDLGGTAGTMAFARSVADALASA